MRLGRRCAAQKTIEHGASASLRTKHRAGGPQCPSTVQRQKQKKLVGAGYQCLRRHTHLMTGGWHLVPHAAREEVLAGARSGAFVTTRRTPPYLFSRHCGLPTEASPTLLLPAGGMRRAALNSLPLTTPSFGSRTFQLHYSVVACQGTKERGSTARANLSEGEPMAQDPSPKTRIVGEELADRTRLKSTYRVSRICMVWSGGSQIKSNKHSHLQAHQPR